MAAPAPSHKQTIKDTIMAAFTEKYSYRVTENIVDKSEVSEYKDALKTLCEDYNDLLQVYKTLANAVNAGKY